MGLEPIATAWKAVNLAINRYPLKKYLNNLLGLAGLEPTINPLWADRFNQLNYKPIKNLSITGFEPVLLPWKGSVLT